MVTIKAFRALRPVPEKAKYVASAPYDVVCEVEARSIVSRNPLSFLRVSLSDAMRASFEPTGLSARQVLEGFIANGVFIQEEEPSIYVYRLQSGEGTQTGIVACCSLDEYEKGLIKRHENTKPEKVEERFLQTLSLRADTGLIFLAFRDDETVKRLILEVTKEEPIYDFVCDSGVRQIIWRVSRLSEEFIEAFANVPALYVADGHHRLESAWRVREKIRSENPSHQGTEEYNYVMAGMFPASELQILPYNRMVKDLNGLSEQEFLESLSERFLILENSGAEKKPSQKGDFCVYFGNGRWVKLRFKAERKLDLIESLDVSILQNFILDRVLGIKDQRTDDRVIFVGGRDSIEKIERAVDAKEARIGFSLYPTSIDELLEVADLGGQMPPKSTWFEPKLKDGLLVHLL
ncbi:MAG: DUF1015 domain-containing protein [Acidobacteria bacterium]|jgi:uncharacterized protein (DUF1015 family)|nr:MAG: DUF1015 domain-containing protein [Acidobacteriota bacterium]GIU81170.1 MAG: hypothetical protein KatS3mg006_0234 [Pyrinomonadaceae bacterium]